MEAAMVGRTALVVGVLITASVCGAYPEDKQSEKSPQTVPPFVQRGQPGKEHARLEPLVGEWKVEGKWMIAGGTAARPLQGENLHTTRTWVAGRRFLQDITEGTVGGSP